ncbi:MAG: OmpA family protein [Gammaproteobacteria bacterium]|nr:OmpA family protein [Gammaproteobacteria bacterium]
MSDNAEKYSVFKALAILLAICLAGLTWLHLWYTDKLKADLAQRAEMIDVSSARLAQADQRIGLLGQTEAELRNDISGLNAQLQAANDASAGLREDIKALNAAHATEIAGLREKHAADLAAEQQKAAEAYAALTGRFDAANEQISVLEGDKKAMQAAAEEAAEQHRQAVADVQQQMANAAAAHDEALAARDASHEEAQKQLENALTKRIVLYRTALEADEPERAAQLNAIDEEMAALRGTIGEGNRQISELETSLADTSGKLAATEEALAASDQQLQATQQQLASTQQQLAESQDALAGLQAEYEEAKQQAATALADSQEALRVANEEHAAREAAADALLAQTREEAAATLAQTQAEAADMLASTKDAAAAELAETRASAQAEMQAAAATAAAAMAETQSRHAGEMDTANGRIADLEGSLANEQAALASLKREYAEFSETKAAELAALERDLGATRSDLETTRSNAAETKATLESRIAAADTRIAQLERQSVLDRQRSAEQLMASVKREHQAVADLRSMYQGFDELGAKRTENGMLLNLGGKELNFRVGQADLRYEELPSLDSLAQFLNAHPALTARIEGHTDSSGRDETNLALSQARAETVMSALAQRGVDPARLSAEGIGEARPVADNETQYGRFLNRRVEIYITGH